MKKINILLVSSIIFFFCYGAQDSINTDENQGKEINELSNFNSTEYNNFLLDLLKKGLEDLEDYLKYLNDYEYIKVMLFLDHNNSEFKDAHYAINIPARAGRVFVVSYLLKYFKYDINTQKHIGEKLLCYAAQGGHISMLEFLAEQSEIKYIIGIRNAISSLDIAAENGKVEALDYLLRQVNFNEETFQGLQNKIFKIGMLRSLNFAMRGGHIKTLEFLLHYPSIKLVLTGESRLNVMCAAAFIGKVDVLDYLLKYFNFEIEVRHKVYLLNKAATGGHVHMVNFLVDKLKIDPFIEDVDGLNAFHSAVSRGNIEALDYLLIISEFNINQKCKEGLTLIDRAIISNKLDTVLYLHNRGAKISDYYCYSNTYLLDKALFYMVNKKLISWLINNGIKITPLCMQQYPDIV